MSKEEEVLAKLSRIMDPDLGKDIVSLDFIKDLEIAKDGRVSFKIELTTPACPMKQQFKTAAQEAVGELDWVTDVAVELTARSGPGPQAGADGLAQVKHIIGVASCKGGVGKSTVAVNLAFTLARQEAKVGLFDADVYGPSLPTMVQVDFDGLYQHNNMIMPLEHASGVKVMSFGYVSDSTGGGPAIMRGPMVSQIIRQLLTSTNWGELDYLIIDLPPGTGDAQLTVAQIASLSASIMVTTPQKLSFVDVVKGIQMFDTLKVPVLAVIENMSHFICDQCGKQHRIFGEGARRRLVEQFGIESSFEFPLDPRVSTLGDSGKPIVLEDPEGPVAKLYTQLAEKLVCELGKLELEPQKPELSYDQKKGMRYAAAGNESFIAPATLRRACRCAECVGELSGKKKLRDEDVPESIEPLAIETMGNYAVNITWSDAHQSIYPYAALEALTKTT